MGDVRVGTASWTDKSVVQSGWYPSGVSSAEERLRYYSNHFPIVEVDSSFYFLPTRKMAEAWVNRTPPTFNFNVKAFSLFTQHPTKPTAVAKVVSQLADKKNIYPLDVPPASMDALWDEFAFAIEPLYDAGKLGAVLFQFPPWFTIKKSNKQYILDCVKRLAPLQICVEFRNKSWMAEENRAETFDFLEMYELPYVCVDMPQGFKSSIPPIIASTSSDLSVIRFHGHNAKEWESGSVQRRFAYLYSTKELEEWVPKIQQLAGETKRTHVLMNNCYSDYAQRNAQELALLLSSTDPASERTDSE